MSDTHHAADERGAGDELPESADPRDTVEAYDTDDGVVFYDALNPLAWLKATRVQTLEERR